MSKDKISFSFERMEWEGITMQQVQFWESAYPDINVVDILKKRMPPWLDANPTKAHKKNWKKFIVNWFAREQEKHDKQRAIA